TSIGEPGKETPRESFDSAGRKTQRWLREETSGNLSPSDHPGRPVGFIRQDFNRATRAGNTKPADLSMGVLRKSADFSTAYTKHYTSVRTALQEVSSSSEYLPPIQCASCLCAISSRS